MSKVKNYVDFDVETLIKKYETMRDGLQNKFDTFKPKNPNRITPTENMWQQVRVSEIFRINQFIEDLKQL
jgi:hypothetical protein